METKIQKWGNSLGVRLPKEIAKNKSLKAGMRVLVSESDEDISIKAVKNDTLVLADMLNAITKDTLHEETSWGKTHGNEVW